ncbi:hypothetical protein [Blastococcus brunescens]|uniref:PLL-like beta propeller domain-containing protein n=1 Tax=Blastococcus brunescens TaxID=1564165 RepID=A0ABZ1B747_9ACTN|nr:hypothetical protein [Blastococcus sp. BMG 8361]WRL64855.1 hypothetical protein U6N30_03685 [Blastococcus sp. BMG 8361]
MSTAQGTAFGPFQRIPGRMLKAPAAVTGNGSRIDLFVVGADRALWHTVTTVDGSGRPTGFAPWQSLGGVLTSSPAAASSTSGRLIVSGRGADGAIWSRTWDGGGWQQWRSAGGLSVSAPAVDVVGADTYRMLVVGTDGGVWSQQVAAATGVPTSAWGALGEATTVAPATSATAWWARDIRAVGYATGSGVRQRWADGRLVPLGGAVTSALGLVEFGPSTTWTFARGTDNALWVNVFTGTGGTWRKIGGVVA